MLGRRTACGKPTWPPGDTRLSPEAALHGPVQNADYEPECETLGTDAYAISAKPLCMHAHACAYQFCGLLVGRTFDLPAYIVEARTTQDVTEALAFANAHDLAVTVKSTGHSYVGSSTARDSLMIWMQNFEKEGKVTTDFADSCGTIHDAVVGIGGGETWNDVIEAVGSDYLVVTGGARTVSAAGGWLQGSGLSFTSRRYGIGVDQVVAFDVVLADGSVVRADACSNPDLFWALRGGGGGTYGVVTHAHYKVHPPTQVIQVSWSLLGDDYLVESGNFDELLTFVWLWLTFWVEKSPTLDSRWSGGFFGPANCYLTFIGTLEEAKESFLDEFDAWYNNVLVPNTDMIPGVWGAFLPSDTASVASSWYEVKGGNEAYNNPASTDATGDAYEDVEEIIGARLMPLETVLNDPNGTRDILYNLTLVDGLGGINYFLGGNVNDIPANETSVHPAMRKAIYSVFANGAVAQGLLRDFIPNTVTGVCYNHHNVAEPEWRNACWGTNYERLNEIKERVDPDHRFNCWHCVGYRGEEIPATGNYTEPPCPTIATADSVAPTPSSPAAPSTETSTLAPVAPTLSPTSHAYNSIDAMWTGWWLTFAMTAIVMFSKKACEELL